MAKYTVLEKSFLDNAMVEAGTVIEFDGEPGPNLELIKEPLKAKSGAPAIKQPETV